MTSKLSKSEIRHLLENDVAFRRRYFPGADVYRSEHILNNLSEYLEEALPMLEELEARGYVLGQISEIRVHERYDDVIPLLLEWLGKFVVAGGAWWSVIEVLSQKWVPVSIAHVVIDQYVRIPQSKRALLTPHFVSIVSPTLEAKLVDLLNGPAQADSGWCRVGILDALAKLKTVSARKAIHACAADPDAPVRRTVAMLLGRRYSHEALKTLAMLADDPDKAVAKAALKALTRLEKKAPKQQQH